MPTAIVSSGRLDVQADNSPVYVAQVHYNVGAGVTGANYSEVRVTDLTNADTETTLNTKLLTALDTEATRLALAAQTVVWGGAGGAVRRLR